MRFKFYHLICAGLLLVTPSSVAQAEDDVELAKEYYDVGAKLFKRSNFEGALKYFRKSFRLSGKPALHYNIARCHVSLGQTEAAIAAYERYLVSPTPRHAELVKARIKNLRLRLKAAQAKRAAEAAERDKAAVEAAGASGAQASASADAPAGGMMGKLGWGLAGGGAALLITGAVLGGLAAGKASEIEEASQDPQRQDFAAYEETEASGQALQTGQIVSLAVGGVAAAAGAVLLYLHFSRDGRGAERQAWIAPAFTTGGAWVSGGVTF